MAEQPTHAKQPEPTVRPQSPAPATPAPGTPAYLPAFQAGLLGLQARAGNAAVTRMLLGRKAHRSARAAPVPSTVQRVGLQDDWPADVPPPHEFHSLPDGYASMSDAQKIEAIRGMLMSGDKSGAAIANAWSLLDDELGMARAHVDLFQQSLKRDDDILDHAAFEPLRETFKKDVEQTALNYTTQNRDVVLAEMKRTGVGEGPEPGADADFAVQDVQKLLPEIERVKTAKARMLSQPIGETEVIETGTRTFVTVYFNPAGPTPGLVPNRYGLPSWEEVNEEWKRNLAVEAALIRKNPLTAYYTTYGGDLSKLKETADIKVARGEIAKGLGDLAARIEKVVPLIGTDLTYMDFPPIQQQLLAGQQGPSGTKWSNPVELAVAKEEIADATISKLLVTLGVATVAGAFFVLASIATAGGAAVLGGVLFAGAAAAGVGQAAYSWDKYRDLATAHEATVDPELALVTSEQVDDAMVSAILDSVFAVLDVWQGVKGAYVGLKGGKAVLEAGKAGAKGSLRNLVKGLARATDKREIVTRALAELGHEETSRLAGMSYEELAEIVGRESDLGKRLLHLGKVGMSETTRELLAKLPKLAELTADEGEQVLRAAVETHGFIGTLKRAGGWAAIKNSAAFKGGSATAKAMEAWRAGIVKELGEYIARESDQMSKAVRTGTEKAASDVDVQILGGAAAELQTKAEGWLAGRLGETVKGAKNMLDAEIFIDPLRSHLIDIMKQLEPGLRAEISARLATKERAMIYGARYRQALKTSQEAADKVLKEADELGITVMKEFEPLSPAAQKRAAALIDQKMTELAKATEAGEKARLVEEIAESQARINASHPDAYVGGGVRVWVTGRDEDVAKIAEALGIAADDLRAVTVAQRVTAALSEAKWLEAALRNLAVPKVGNADDLAGLAKAVSNIGKHGGRAAGQLSKTGAPNAARLEALYEALMKFKTMPADELGKRLKGGELGAIRGEIDGLLAELKTQTKAAVDALGADARGVGVDLARMAEWQKLVDWQIRYAQLVDSARGATGAYIEILHGVLQERLQASVAPPEATQSAAPPVAQPSPVPAPLSIARSAARPTHAIAGPRPAPSTGSGVRRGRNPGAARLGSMVQRQSPSPSGSTPAGTGATSAPATAPTVTVAPPDPAKVAALDEILRAGDVDRLKALPSFPALTPTQMLSICNLILTQAWVGPFDEKCLERAWTAYGPAERLDETDWALWKRCEDAGAEIKNVPWMAELRFTFAEDSRDLGYRNLEANQKYLEEEARALGIQLPGQGPPPATRIPETTPQQRLEQRQKTVRQLIQMKKARQKLETLHVGYEVPRDKAQPNLKAPLSLKWNRMRFDPDNEPNQGPTGYEQPPMPTWAEVKSVYDELGRQIGRTASTSPLAYALLSQDDLEDYAGADAGQLGAKAEEALKTSLEGVRKTRENLEPPRPTLGFEHLKPVHERLFAGAGRPVWRGPFAQAMIRDYVADEKGDEGQLAALLGAGAFILIVASIATGGAALAAFGAIMGIAGSLAGAAESIERASAVQGAAHAQVNKDTGLVETAEVSETRNQAILDVAFALLDLYGAAKAVKAAASAAILAGWRGARTGGEQLARLATLSAAERATVVGAAVEREGVAAAISRTGRSADELLAIVGKESAAGKRIAEYIATVAKGGAVAIGEVMPKLARLGELSAHEADAVVRSSIDLLGPARTLELAGGWASVEAKVGRQAPVMERLRGWREGIKDDVGAFLAERRAGSGATGTGTDRASTLRSPTSGPAEAKADFEAARSFVAARTGVTPDKVEDVLRLGLGSEEQMEKFLASAVAKGKLIGAAAAVERRAILTAMVNERLREAGVPDVLYSLRQESGGAFNWKTWSIRFDEARMTKPALGDADVREMLLEVYHEARHAEQMYMAARAKVGEGRSVAWLKSEMALPDRVATAAHANPLRPSDAGYGHAVEWFESVWGANRQWRETVIDGKRAAERSLVKAHHEWREAIRDLRAVPEGPQYASLRTQCQDKAQQWAAEFAHYEKQYEEFAELYRKLPEEREAYGVEEILKSKIDAYQKAQAELRDEMAKLGAPSVPNPTP